MYPVKVFSMQCPNWLAHAFCLNLNTLCFGNLLQSLWWTVLPSHNPLKNFFFAFSSLLLLFSPFFRSTTQAYSLFTSFLFLCRSLVSHLLTEDRTQSLIILQSALQCACHLQNTSLCYWISLALLQLIFVFYVFAVN